LNRLVFKPYRSISDQVFEFLKERIVTSDIRPGSRLLQAKLAEELQVSRMPIREAFHRLQQAGFVERVPQGGVRVSPLSAQTINEVLGIRGILEAYAIELACDGITPDDLMELKLILRRARELTDSTSVDRETKIKKLFELNTRLHDLIYRATGNAHLIKLIGDLKDLVLRMRAMSVRKDSSWLQTWQDHGQLVDCLERRDKEEAVRIMKAHIANAAYFTLLTAEQDEGEASQGGPGEADGRDDG